MWFVHRAGSDRIVHSYHRVSCGTSPVGCSVPGVTTPRSADDPRYTRIWLRRELVAAGYPDKAIRRLTRRRVLVRVRHGAYVDHDAWACLDEVGRHCVRSRAVLRQASTPLVLSHTSALAEHDGPTYGVALDEVDVLRPEVGGRRESGIRHHRGRVPEQRIERVGGVAVTDPATTTLDLAMLVPTEAALCVANHFLHRARTTLPELAGLARDRERWPGSLSTHLILRLADARIESVGESRVVWLCFQQGLPAPVPQYPVRDGRGRVVARVDFAWPELGVFVEFDGQVKYGRLLKPGESLADVVDAEKRREEQICRLTGWRCVRLVWADLDRPERTAYRIRSMFGHGPVPGTA